MPVCRYRKPYKYRCIAHRAYDYVHTWTLHARNFSVAPVIQLSTFKLSSRRCFPTLKTIAIKWKNVLRILIHTSLYYKALCRVYKNNFYLKFLSYQLLWIYRQSGMQSLIDLPFLSSGIIFYHQFKANSKRALTKFSFYLKILFKHYFIYLKNISI